MKLAEWRKNKVVDASAGKTRMSEDILVQSTKQEMDCDPLNTNPEADCLELSNLKLELDVGALVQVRHQGILQTAVLQTLPDQGPVTVRIFGSNFIVFVEREDLVPCTESSHLSGHPSRNYVQLIGAEETIGGELLDLRDAEDGQLHIACSDPQKMVEENQQIDPATKPVVVLKRLSLEVIRKSGASINETSNLSGSPSRKLICEGDLVWARLLGYPHWPAVVLNKKGRGRMCRKTIKGVRKVSVIFLGEKKQTAWVPETAVVQFTDGNQFPLRQKFYKSKCEWESAVKVAEDMLTCDIPCRMFYFS